MICPDCQHENEDQANFCAHCGAKLPRICPNCGTVAAPTANFCSNCGQELKQKPSLGAKSSNDHLDRAMDEPASYTPAHLAKKILRDRQIISGERRTITVLFVDAVGSSALGEQLDPEAIYTLTQDALRIMMADVHAYEGTIAQFRGDGILALFGAPIAHEDAARRAVGAALDMQRNLEEFGEEVKQRYGVALRFRVGLNTGRVVVGRIGDNLDMEFTALGDSVNLGARMESAAEPGTVYLTEDTFRASQDFFDFEAIGEIVVKGKSDPILVYKALGERTIRSRFAVAAERGLTPYVGRRHELALMERNFALAKGGRGQVILINGEAGIGKSRLLLEFRRSIKGKATWLEGQCISFGKNIPYRPIIDIVKNGFGVEEKDSEAEIIQRIEQASVDWDQTTKETIPYLKALLSVDPGNPAILQMDPRDRRAGILDGLRALLLEVSRNQPLVISVEDLHWIDEQSEAALTALVDIIAAASVLLLLTYRPGYVHSLGERTYFDHLAIGDLLPEQSIAVAESVLQEAALPTELASLITGKGEGNPFYIEEVTKSLLEAGVLQKNNGSYQLAQPVASIRVPDTIQEVILSRIDRLEEEAKAALQLASVIGREFTARLLDRITDLELEVEEVLGELKALELIYQDAYFPELSYMFKHALTQDVAYRTLLRERRKTLHRLIGSAIEELYADRLPEHLEMLAHHYHEGEAWEKALEYLIKAGDKAANSYANHDALEYYTRVFKVCERLETSKPAIIADVAWKRALLNWTMGDLHESANDFTRVRDAARALSDKRLEGSALSIRGMTEMMDHDMEAAEKSLRTALSLAGQEYEDVRFFASAVLGHALRVFYRPAESKSFADTALELAPTINDPFMLRWWRMYESAWLNWDARFAEALKVQRRLEIDDVEISAVDLTTLWIKALALGGNGNCQQALDLLKRLLDTCERVGDLPIRIRIYNSLGWIYAEIQNHQKAFDWNTQGVIAAQEAGFQVPEVESNARLNLADNLMSFGRFDEAEEHFRHVLQIVRHPREQDHMSLYRYSQHLFHSYGELCLARGDIKQALAYTDECLELAENSNGRRNIIKGRRLRGQAFMAEGLVGEAKEELSVALELATQVGNPTQLWLTHAAQGDLCSARRLIPDAQSAYQEALNVIQQVADDLEDDGLREVLLTSNSVGEIKQSLARLMRSPDKLASED